MSPQDRRGEMIDQIISLVISRRLPVESRTSEATIAQLLAYPPRTLAVHEALGILVGDGIMGVRSQVGYWARRVSMEQAYEALRGRASEESIAVAELSLLARRDPSHVEPLMAILDDLEAVSGTDDVVAFHRLDAAFHVTLPLAAQCSYISNHVRAWTDVLRVYRADHPFDWHEKSAIVGLHRALVVQLRDGNPLGAKHAVLNHMNAQVQYLSTELSERVTKEAWNSLDQFRRSEPDRPIFNHLEAEFQRQFDPDRDDSEEALTKIVRDVFLEV